MSQMNVIPVLTVMQLAILLSGDVCCFAGDGNSKRGSIAPLTPDDQKTATFFLQGIWSDMETLRSAVVNIREEYTYGKGESKKSRISYYLYLADYGADRIRFEHRIDNEVYQYIRNDEESLFRIGVGDYPRSINRYPRDREIDVSNQSPVDLRAFGVMTRYGYDEQRSIEQYWKLFDKVGKSAILEFEQGERFLKYTWHFDFKDKESQGKLLFWLDRTMGNQPVRMEEYYRLQGKTNWELSSRSDTKWKLVNRVWVPTKWSGKTVAVPARLVLSFEWKTVNEPIPKSEFTYEKFDAPDGTAVFNHRLGKPILEKRLGVPPVVRSDFTESMPSRRNSWSIIGVNAVLVIGVVCALWVRRRGRPVNND